MCLALIFWLEVLVCHSCEGRWRIPVESVFLAASLYSLLPISTHLLRRPVIPSSLGQGGFLGSFFVQHLAEGGL